VRSGQGETERPFIESHDFLFRIGPGAIVCAGCMHACMHASIWNVLVYVLFFWLDARTTKSGMTPPPQSLRVTQQLLCAGPCVVVPPERRNSGVDEHEHGALERAEVAAYEVSLPFDLSRVRQPGACLLGGGGAYDLM
jgi:hypothetical protein